MKAFTLVALFGLLGATSAAVVPQERSFESISADSAMAKRCGYGGRRGRDIEPECIPSYRRFRSYKHNYRPSSSLHCMR
ncbi:hypothetical protein B0J17DRAFT_675314 [Rhizoctonia solani]|nr:hypothetical protein B0J17DRAFT_675314 [Rhizoctonia solani]